MDADLAGLRRTGCGPAVSRAGGWNPKLSKQMAKHWQKVEARAVQSRGVWALVPGFVVRGKTLAAHEDLETALRQAAGEEEAAKLERVARRAELRSVFREFKTMNAAVAARLESELEAADSLRGDLVRLKKLQPDSREKIEKRTLMTLECWQALNDRRAAETPARPELLVRDTTWAAHEARWKELPGLRLAAEEADLDWRAAKAALAKASKVLSGLNVDWFKAWKSEYAPGTPENDALAGVKRFPPGARRKRGS